MGTGSGCGTKNAVRRYITVNCPFIGNLAPPAKASGAFLVIGRAPHTAVVSGALVAGAPPGGAVTAAAPPNAPAKVPPFEELNPAALFM